ncbi:MAG TPA: hypothetical protein VKB87_09425 [Myxococcaceae bacterium]|nr:hypothetical protein [Myxococcaceae bacterium]
MSDQEFEEQAAIQIMAALITTPPEQLHHLSPGSKATSEGYAGATYHLVKALVDQRKKLGKSERLGH